MTIKLINKVDSKSLEELRSFCQSIKHHMTLDNSNYAKGRKRLWLFHECNLRNTDLIRGFGFFDKRLWNFCQRAYPGCNIGLLTYGGEGSTGLIDWHRDHTYAQPIARTVNLGEAIFGYDLKRDGGIKTDTISDRKEFKLNDGEIIEFNCKHPHALLKIVSKERFSINLWKLNESKGYKPLF
jgi:hypothetical protein